MNPAVNEYDQWFRLQREVKVSCGYCYLHLCFRGAFVSGVTHRGSRLRLGQALKLRYWDHVLVVSFRVCCLLYDRFEGSIVEFSPLSIALNFQYQEQIRLAAETYCCR